MGLIDKAKAQASQLAQKAQEAGKAGQAKFEDVQAKRRADGLLRDLGAAVFAQRSGKANDQTPAEIDRLVGEISTYEAENGPLDSSGATETHPDATKDTETPPGGDFKL